ncbi:hypothetical protein SAMN05216359_105249 [Roseateles sp. YR242]|nr:hypothetical protein SAMN05216359_105249 [Roseateles sp. YR242]
MQGGSNFYPDPTPCWHCHWFGYLMAENGHGVCVNPNLVAVVATPRNGCAHWRREPGSDDSAWPPEAVGYRSPVQVRIEAERDRLVKIRELGQRAALPHGVYAECRDRSGILAPSGFGLTADPSEAQAVIERLGVNAAIRSGRL